MAVRGTAVAVYDRFPHSVDYSTARPVMLLRDMGLAVHVVEIGPAARWTAEGVTRWRRPSRARVAAVVARIRPDLLFLEGSTWHLALLPFARRSWVRATGRSARAASARLQRALVARASVVSVSNPHHADEWRLPKARLLEFPYPFDAAFWSTPVDRDDQFWTSRGIDPPYDGPVVSYAAQLLRRKRQPEVVSALAPVLRSRPTSRLVFAGGPVEPGVDGAIVDVAAARGVAAQVHVVGALSGEDLRQLMAWTTVHVVNSEWETQCLVVYESLAAGVANAVSDIDVLTSAFPALPSHHDETELCHNVTRLLDDAAERARVVAASRERLGWADMARHDQLFTDTVTGLLR